MSGLSGLSGLGGLASGFQQGVGFVQDLQDARQRHKMRKYALNQMGRDDTAAQANSMDITDEERAFYGDDLTEAFLPEVGEDPWLFRMMDRARKRRSKRKTALPTSAEQVASSAEVAEPDMSAMPDPALAAEEDPDLYSGYADGGRVDPDDPEEVKKRAARNRAATSDRGSSTTTSARGVDRTAPRKQAMKTSGGATAAEGQAAKKGLLRRAMGSRVAGGAAALAGVSGALRSGATGTEDYYERFGMNPEEAGLSFWKDLGARTLGTLSDVGSSAAGMIGIDLDKNFADKTAQGGMEVTDSVRRDVSAMGGMENARLAAQGGGASPTQLSTTAIRSRPSGGAPAPAPAPKQYEPGDAIDLSAVDFDETELPDLKVDDWKRYRAQALRTARLKGLPQAEALEFTDKLVTGMQIRGFSNYASQAAALMHAGNMKGAIRALRAAYQYFPDGNDVKFGVQNGKIIGVGYDETTNEPFEGGTRVITPEFLAGAIQNFQNPQNFLAWTKDWRDEQFKRQRYEEMEKPLAEAQGQALRTNAEANVARAEAAELRAQLTGRGGGLKPSDMRGSEQVYRQRLELMGITDPATADQLAAVMSQIKQANPNVPDNMIVDFVMKAQARPDGMQFIQRALSGQ